MAYRPDLTQIDWGPHPSFQTTPEKKYFHNTTKILDFVNTLIKKSGQSYTLRTASLSKTSSICDWRESNTMAIWSGTLHIHMIFSSQIHLIVPNYVQVGKK